MQFWTYHIIWRWCKIRLLTCSENLVRIRKWAGCQGHYGCSSHCELPSTEISCTVVRSNDKPTYRIHRVSTRCPVLTMNHQLYSHYSSNLFRKLHLKYNIIEVITITIHAKGKQFFFLIMPGIMNHNWKKWFKLLQLFSSFLISFI